MLDSAEESDEISNEFDFKNEVFSHLQENTIFLVVLLTLMLAESNYLLIQVLDVDVDDALR